VSDATIADRIAALESRVEELERRPTLRYLGVWTVDRAYTPGDFVTYAGSLWACSVACVGVKPGKITNSPSRWQLAVKAGRDGRDVRSWALSTFVRQEH
jgi:hypothetical protein